MTRRMFRSAALALLAATAVPAGPLAATAYLVMPFDNLSEAPSLDWMSSCLALSLGEHLRGLGAQVMDDEERSILLEGSGIPSGARLTLASTLDLGRRMRERPTSPRPDRTVLGRFQVTDGDLTLQVRSIDLTREYASPWISREGRLKDLLDLHNRLADSLVSETDDTLPRGRSAGRQPKDLPLLTFETYCRAMAETDAPKRLTQLRRALREFPDYHRAAYQAAALLSKAERWDEAAALLAQAEGDPQPYLLELHLLGATVALQRRQPEAAAAAARRAIERADTARARLLLGRALIALGDRPAATAELEKAAILDPSDPEIEDLRRAIADATAATGAAP